MSFQLPQRASLAAEQSKRSERIKYHADHLCLELEDRLNGTEASSKCKRRVAEWGNKSDKIKSQRPCLDAQNQDFICIW